jgi:predicted small metal-binding protein
MPFVCQCLDLGYLDRWRARGEEKAEVMGLLVAHLAGVHGIAPATSTLTSYLQRYIHEVDADDLFRATATRSTE